ncbi:MAG: succinylglutamate desuccinylase/aspartoacylase family protein [Candidatus Bathyarchaeota archaeon]
MSFRIQDTVIEQGETRRGYIKIGDASTHEVKLPYIVINGAKKGPTVTILAGVHAVECAPVEAVYRLAETVKPEKLTGTLILVPIVNTEGFHARQPYHNQLDHLNQNKVFPGDPEASITKRVAYQVFEHFVSKSDVLIDAHSADLGEDVTRGIFIYRTDNKKLYDKMVELASQYNPAFIETTSISGNTGEAVNIYGIPCLMIESGAPYPIREKDVQYHYEGAVNLLKHMKMLEGKAAKYNPIVDPPSQRLWVLKGGIWRRKVEAGQRVKEGENLGMVCDILGEQIQSVASPFDGVVSFLRVHYSVNSGDTLLWVAKA